MLKLKYLALLWLALTLPAWAEPGISLQGGARQGGVLFVRVPESESCRQPELWFQGHGFKLFPAGSCREAVLPIDADTKAGGYKIKLAFLDSQGQKHIVERSLKISKTGFPYQYLTLSADNASKYEDPAVEREYNLIHGALGKVTPDKLWQGDFILPCAGEWSTLYGTQRYVNGESHGYHRGVDIAAGWGTPVKAANSGTVALIGEDFILNGKTVILDHGMGVNSAYLHLSKILVKPGQKVIKGEVIAKVGNTGAGTGAHLHWGTYVLGTPVEPHTLLQLPADWR